MVRRILPCVGRPNNGANNSGMCRSPQEWSEQFCHACVARSKNGENNSTMCRSPQELCEQFCYMSVTSRMVRTNWFTNSLMSINLNAWMISLVNPTARAIWMKAAFSSYFTGLTYSCSLFEASNIATFISRNVHQCFVHITLIVKNL